MSEGLRELLGIDPETFRWQDLASCAGDETNDHYDNYESDAAVAKVIDQKCLSCPVMAQCLQYGIDNGEWGTWGAVYLVSGKPDDNRNSHKTQEVWEEIRERISDDPVF